MKIRKHGMNSQTSSATVKNNFEDAIRDPRLFQKKFSIRYFLATRLLSRRVRKDVEYLYAFVRIPDEIIDTEYKDNLVDGLKALDLFEQEWKDVYFGISKKNKFLLICRNVFKKYNIPFDYSLDFMKAMKQDGIIKSYETYSLLEGYMHGSAGVIGYMLSYIFGFKDKALANARSLAFAMQMTNFLRDIKEDYDLRGRIYLPIQDMNKYGVTSESIKLKKITPSLISLIKYEIVKTRKLYEEGYSGIVLLSPDTRLAVFVSGRMYERVLDRIERFGHNPFLWKSENNFMKILYLFIALFEYYYRYKYKKLK